MCWLVAEHRIGHVRIRQPNFNRGPGSGWRVEIYAQSLPWGRDMGTSEENDMGQTFTLGPIPGWMAGGGITQHDLVTYGGITSVTWTYRNTRENRCGRGYTRVLFAYQTDPVGAGRILAACEPSSKA